MPKNLDDATTFTSPVAVPVDADVRNAASVETPFQALANRTAFLRRMELLNWFPQDVSDGGGTKLVAAAWRADDVDPWAVAVGESNEILYTDFGFVWTQATHTGANPFRGVAHSVPLDLWLVVGDLGDIAYSQLGATWTNATRGHGLALRGVVAADGFFIVVGNGIIETTPNGTAWTTREDALFLSYRGVTYAPSIDVAVAVADGGSIVYSDDGGLTWAAVSPDPTAENLLAVAWDAEHAVFCAVGANGAILTSTNGSVWVTRSSGWTGDILAVAASTDGTLLAVGANVLLISLDGGVTWKVVVQDRGASYDGVAKHATDGWIVVGQDNAGAALLITSLRVDGRNRA